MVWVLIRGDEYSCRLLCSVRARLEQGESSCSRKSSSPEKIARAMLKMSRRSKACPRGMLGCIAMRHS